MRPFTLRFFGVKFKLIMDKQNMRIFFLTAVLSCFCYLLSGAQSLLKTSVDKNEILIGDQFKLTIEASFSPEGYKIVWPLIPDSLQHFEVISRKTDSLFSNDKVTGAVQVITITSFDSGKWVLPSFAVNIKPVNADTTIQLLTDTIPITISFSASDTTSQLKDIKTIRDVETVKPIWYWVGAGVLLAGVIIFLTWLYRKWKKKALPVPFKTRQMPYEEAMKELEHLKTYNLSVATDIKIVHTKLGEIVKRYLTRTHKNNYENKTTGDILIMLRDEYLDKEMLAKAAASLRGADAVKFAKYLPAINQSEESIQQVKEVIQTMHQLIAKDKVERV